MCPILKCQAMFKLHSLVMNLFHVGYFGITCTATKLVKFENASQAFIWYYINVSIIVVFIIK